MSHDDIYQLCMPDGVHREASPQDQWRQLADAVIEKAVEDYCNALAGMGYYNKPASVVKAECERFFRSKWFTTLSSLDGETVIHRLSTGCVQGQEGA